MNHNCNPYNLSFTTEIDVQEQIDAIKQATANASKSREAALQFLVDAGILSEKEVKEPPKEKKQ